jgi:hypothetical protein
VMLPVSCAELGGELLALDPRHGMFPNLVMTPLIATLYASVREQREVVLECSPKADPGVMRVPAAWTAGRILDERQASQPRTDHQEAA